MGTEGKSILGVVVFLLFIGYVWYKVEAARERERLRRRRRGRNAANPTGNANLTTNPRDEIRKLSARQRYLESKNWENQCICLALCSVMDYDISSTSNMVSFKSMEIVSLLKQIAKKHRLYVIHLLPREITEKLDKDEPAEKSQYEIDVVQLFERHGIVQSGLPVHKILFCTTQKGKSSMVRQLMPTLYVDSDEIVLKELHQHLAEVVQVTSLIGAGGVAPTVFVTKSVQS